MPLTIQTAGDLAHTRTRGYRDRVARAITIIEDAMASSRCVVACSWGKDSVAMADMALAVTGTPIIHMRWCGHGVTRPPGLDHVRDSLLTRWDLTPWRPWWEPQATPEVPYQVVPHEVSETHSHHRSTLGWAHPSRHQHCPSPQLASMYLEVPIEAPEPGWDSTAKRSPERRGVTLTLRRNANRTRAAYQDIIDADTVLLGLRARESGNRAAHLATRGTSWATQYGMTGCAPMAWLTNQDIWGYLAHHDLPVSPHYHRSPDGRNRQRSELVETRGAWCPEFATAMQYALGGDR